jgi:hypothetical protein
VSNRARVFVALVHHPVLDRDGAVVATAVTNLDVHDLARASRKFGVEAYYVVTPVDAQLRLVEEIRAHWIEGPGKKRVPDRHEAIRVLRTAPSIEDVRARIERETGRAPFVVATAARAVEGSRPMAFSVLRERLEAGEVSCVILFGTGHGLVQDVVQGADALLPPIDGPTGYNHLSVRAAAAIVLDRLLGR